MGKARELGVTCEIWDQSRLAAFLDIDATGQYLRQRFLGYGAEPLSMQLLRQIGPESIDRLATHTRLRNSPITWIHRGPERNIWAALHRPGAELHLIVGQSGFGKTVIA